MARLAKWFAAVNDRRGELALKGRLTPDEKREFADLTARVDAEVSRVYPLPLVPEFKGADGKPLGE